MLLRTAALLLLCASVGLCATLALHQTSEPEEDSQAAAAAAVSVDGDGLGQVPAEEPQANLLPAENLLVRTLTGSEPATDGADGNADGADGAATNKLEREVGDGPAGDGATRTPASLSLAEGGNDIRPVRSMMRDRAKAQEESSWSINSIRSSFQSAHGYFNSLVELVGGRNGVCQYRCRYGKPPSPRPGYQLSQPDGCSNSLTGFQGYQSFDMGIPAMTNCCNQLDTCYETCGTNKEECDAEFRTCLHGICSDIDKSLGFESKLQACGSVADTLHRMVQTLGCRPYMNSQRAACFCEGEEKDEL